MTQAGCELDALVAEKVMGWTFTRPTHGTCCTCQNCGRAYDSCGDSCNYSTEIAAAWQVVDKLREPDREVQIYTDRNSTTVNVVDGDHVVEARADTAPLAICLAALAAKGMQVV